MLFLTSNPRKSIRSFAGKFDQPNLFPVLRLNFGDRQIPEPIRKVIANSTNFCLRGNYLVWPGACRDKGKRLPA